MKKFLTAAIVLVLALMFITFLSACNKEESGSTVYTVKFETNGGGAVEDFTGNVLSVMPVPVKEGEIFEGWYTNKELSGVPVSFPYAVYGDITLYARWYAAAEGSPGLVYELDGNSNGYKVMRYDGASHLVTLPEKYSNKPVTAVADGAFSGASFEKISIPSSVKEIGRAFYRASLLKEIEVNANNAHFLSLDGVLYNKSKAKLFSFPPAKISEHFEIPSTVAEVENFAFRFCINLKSVAIPQGLVTMERYFDGCSALEKIETAASNQVFISYGGVLYSRDGKLLRFPAGNTAKEYSVMAGTSAVAQYAFDDGGLERINLPASVSSFAGTEAAALKEITVDDGNASFSSIGGVLFDKSGTNLILFPRNKDCEGAEGEKTYTVPDGVKNICGLSFLSVLNLNTVILPAELETISDNAFDNIYGCFELKSVEFAPSSRLSSVGAYAFSGITSLTDVKFTSVIPPLRGEGVFAAGTTVRITVPEASLPLYTASAWNTPGVILLGGGASEKFNVSYVTNGGSAVPAQNVSYIAASPESTRGGYAFGGWYLDAEFEGKAAFPLSVTAPVSLYALWHKIISGGENMVFKENTDGTYSVTKYTGKEKTITVPTLYNGALVTAIGNNAFLGMDFIEEVILPSSVSRIGENAFAALSSASAMRLKSIKLEEIYLKSIGKYAFRYCIFLNDLSFPSSLTAIENGAFEGCASLKNIDLKNVLNLGDFVFSGCAALEAFSVSGNAPFTAEDGVLYNKDKTALIKYPQNKSGGKFIIPDTVNAIMTEAFFSSALLTEAVLPPSPLTIEARAFYNCPLLNTLSVPEGFTEFSFAAFKYSAIVTVNLPSTLKDADFDFSDLPYLDWINVSSGNTDFKSVDGILYNYALTELIKCPPAKKAVNVPQTISVIAPSAFAYCAAEMINLNDITEIGERAFYGSSVKKIFAESVLKIGAQAFAATASLISVQFMCGVPVVGQNAFSGSSCIVVVPAEHLDEYNAVLKITVASATEITGNLHFELINDEYYRLSSVLTSGAEIVIPGSVNGKEVREIGAYAFNGENRVVIIPKEVKIIYSYAFAFSGVASIIFENRSGISDIKPNAFSETGALANIVFSIVPSGGWNVPLTKNIRIFVSAQDFGNPMLSGLDLYDRSLISGDFAFDSGEIIAYLGGAKTVSVPGTLNGENVVSIGGYFLPAFAEEVILPDSVATILPYAFSQRGDAVPSRLVSVVFSAASTADIGGYAFAGTGVRSLEFYSPAFTSLTFEGAQSLENISVTGGGYLTQDGILYSSAKDTLIRYPAAKRGMFFSVPETVVNIGAHAFSGALHLAEVTLPEGLENVFGYAFDGCSSLMNLVLPDSLKTIDAFAFKGCSKLILLSLPGELSAYDGTAVFACAGLERIESYSDAFYSLDGVIFSSDGSELLSYPAGKTGAYTIPDTVRKIAPYAFSHSRLTSISVPAAVVDIGGYAFAFSAQLLHAEIKGALISLGNGLFEGCAKLETLILPDTVAEIGSRFLYGCEKLYSFNFPSSLELIGEYAFAGCARLTAITVPSGVTTLGDGCFALCLSVTKIVLPQKLTAIGLSVLGGCNAVSSLTMNTKFTLSELFGSTNGYKTVSEVIIHEGESVLPDRFFSGNGYIETAVLPSTLSKIGAGAFYECIKLTKVTVSGNFGTQRLVNIGEEAFWACVKLSRFEIKVPVPPSAGDNAFKYAGEGGDYILPLLTVYVPGDCVGIYAAAWGVTAKPLTL